MQSIRVCDDLDECRRIWDGCWPGERLFDLWPVRACFAGHYDHRPHFLVAERGGAVVGALALSWVEDAGYYGQFPGETCHGRTWLEENRIPAREPGVREALCAAIPGPAQVRYLTRSSLPADPANVEVDEIGYLFFPPRYGFSFDTYLGEFSRKSRKRLDRELAGLETLGLSVRHDRRADVEQLLRMSLEAFGDRSYFADQRFLRSFEDLMAWLSDNGMLRVTSILLGGELAAVDVGATLGRTHTVLAGGTRPEFPGVAKLINFHHLRWACATRLERIDFLCGDFGWKERFHLSQRPLFQLTAPAGQSSTAGDGRDLADVA